MSTTSCSLEICKAIMERRSIRHFLDTPIQRELLLELLGAATWAPSGLNNQPWRFAIVWDAEIKQKLAG
ncbi:MAG TPA: hypothetical protein DCZ69_16305 [Syntrophobacteraceae bacterium]|nr:hypothetical protein [Syntrophobacteraceae bacterium]